MITKKGMEFSEFVQSNAANHSPTLFLNSSSSGEMRIWPAVRINVLLYSDLNTSYATGETAEQS